MNKHIRLYFTFVISAIFGFQNTLLAEELKQISYNDYALQEYSKALVTGMKYNEVFGKIKVNGPRDKELLKNILETYGEKKIPVPVINGNVLTFINDNVKLEIEFVDYMHEKFKVNGYEADFSNHKTLSDKIEYATRILKSKKQYSFFGLKNSVLMSSFFQVKEAEALVPLVLWGAVLLVNTAAWGRVAYVLNSGGKLDVYDQMNVGIVTEANKCKRDAETADTMDDIVGNGFNCDNISEFKMKIGDQECFSTESHPNHTLTGSMKACCAKNKKECTKKYNEAFSIKGATVPASKNSNGVYRSN